MSAVIRFAPHLPYLRRHARALTGSQAAGDQAVRRALEAVANDPMRMRDDTPARVELYRLFHAEWRGDASAIEFKTLSASAHAALQLTAVEGFSQAETAEILGITEDQVTAEVNAARASIRREMSCPVLVIEDESIIAMHLQSIVEEMGHKVVGTATTHREAVAVARRTKPELVLADIRLADGSSGINAVKDILAEFDVPVIFITAYPERLLSGDRPEPTYLITKPFMPETVSATIGQALMMKRAQNATAA